MNQTSKARINITQRMLNKSIIDANKSVVAFVRDCYPTLGYDFIVNGGKKCFWRTTTMVTNIHQHK